MTTEVVPAAATRYAFEFDGREIDRLVTIAGDLEFLQSLPRKRLLTHTEVRVAAGVLRRILIDGQLNSVLSSAVGQRPILTVEAVSIDDALRRWSPSWIKFAFAGGAEIDGAHHLGFILAGVPKNEVEAYESPSSFVKANPIPLQGELRRMSISDYMASTAAAIGTSEQGLFTISRATVLQYLANKKGGVHYDPRRNLELKNPQKWRREAAFHLLDHGLLRVGHLSGPEFEIQSMVRVLAEADWASELIRLAEEAAPADFRGDPKELRFWTGMQEADGTGWATGRFDSSQVSPDPSQGGPSRTIESAG